jgi:hypothetical protein
MMKKLNIKQNIQKASCMAFLLPVTLALFLISSGGRNSIPEDSDVTPSAFPFPQDLETIPAAYNAPATQQGTLVELYYDTYESRTYAQKTRQLRKRAIVYLPYDYSEGRKYNVFYLMHGGWGNETSTLGTPQRPSPFKNVIDNAIADGAFEPLIIVCPTYNNESPEDSGNFSLALELNRNYHNELINDLIPAAESAYSTHAENTSPEDLIKSRVHRGFGGFSMGSVATWRTFQYCLDYFQYFLPMSCGTSLDDENIFAAAAGHAQGDYFVFVITGTNDFAYSYDNNRVTKMRNSPYFTELDNEHNGNFVYRVKEGYSHDGRASTEYTYNGLRCFWSEDSGSHSAIEHVSGRSDLFSVYPNPANDCINVSGGDFQSLTLFNINGSRLIQTKDNTINLRAFPAAIYILNINVKQGETVVKKIIKK